MVVTGVDAVLCRDANCELLLHTRDIGCFYERVISCIKCAESECTPSKPTQLKFKAIPFCSERRAVVVENLY